MRIFAVISLYALGLPACTSASPSTVDKIYKPSDVVANHSALHGKKIKVQGYLVLEDGAHGLWDSAQDLEYLKSSRPGPDDFIMYNSARIRP